MQILSVFILAAFCGAIHAGDFLRRDLDRSNHVDVIILGAGVAGLTAAKTLSENNVTNFLILEGSDRIGGRIKHCTIDGNALELGSIYIVGTEGNPVWELAQKYNLSGKITNYDDIAVLKTNMTDVTETEAKQAWEGWENAADKLNKTFYDIKAKKVEDMSLRAAIKMGGWFPTTPVKEVVEWFDSADFTFLQPADLISLKWQQQFIQQLKTDGSNEEYLVNDKKGFVHIFDEMKNEFLTANDTRLKLNEIVKTIKTSDTKVTVTTKTNNVYTADYVIMTFGIGVIQNRKVKFEPELPAWKEETLFRINIGQAANIMVKASGTNTFFNKKEYVLIASERPMFLPLWVNLMSDGLLPDSSNIFSAMPIGDAAKIVERMDKDVLKSEIHKMLKDVNSNIGPPESICVSDWSTNPLFMGSGAGIPVGFTDDQKEMLKAPVSRLYFAGEAYHDVFTGHIQGAYYSGRDQAKEIIKCREKLCKKYEPPRKTESDCQPSTGSFELLLPSLLVEITCLITSYIHV